MKPLYILTIDRLKKMLVFACLVIGVMGLMFPDLYEYDGAIIPAIAVSVVAVYVWNRLAINRS